MYGNVHGTPGGRLAADPARYGSAGRRGVFFEKTVARALTTWLSRRPDRQSIHLFHDLDDFGEAPAMGPFPPLNVGTRNIDHLLITGDRWLIIESKGIGAGTLRMAGNQVYLSRANGDLVLQPWANSLEMWPMRGVVHRLTGGMDGQVVWVLPSSTVLHENLRDARFLSRGGWVTTVRDIYRGEMGEALPPGQPPADPGLITRLRRYVRR